MALYDLLHRVFGQHHLVAEIVYFFAQFLALASSCNALYDRRHYDEEPVQTTLSWLISISRNLLLMDFWLGFSLNRSAHASVLSRNFLMAELAMMILAFFPLFLSLVRELVRGIGQLIFDR